MATKLGRIVTFLDELLSIKSHDPLIKLQAKTISALSQCLWPLNLVGY